jgi:hypothetical protein
LRFIGFDREHEAVDWAKSVLGIYGPTGFTRCLSAVDANDQFVFVTVLSGFSRYNIDMHTAAVPGAQWASPKAAIQMFNGVFGYAFEKHKVERVTGLVAASNHKAREFDEHLGFKLEGVMRKAFNGEDLCIYGFLKEDFENHRWRRG